jgi:hypothetical protein
MGAGGGGWARRGRGCPGTGGAAGAEGAAGATGHERGGRGRGGRARGVGDEAAKETERDLEKGERRDKVEGGLK